MIRAPLFTLAAILLSGCGTVPPAETTAPGREQDFAAAGSSKSSSPVFLAEVSKEKQVKISSKLIVTPFPPTTGDGAILSEADMAVRMRELAESESTVLATAPSLTARLGQQAIIEIIRTQPGQPQGSAEDLLKGTSPFWGLVLAQEVGLEEDGAARVDLECHYRFAPGMEHIQTTSQQPDEIPWDRLRSARGKTSARVLSGQTLCFDMGEIEPGVFLQLFSRVEAIDSTGRPLARF
jgi:hypothetical protein